MAMMKFFVPGLALLLLTAQCALSQATNPMPSPDRDARGFLPTQTAPGEASPAPILEPAVAIPSPAGVTGESPPPSAPSADNPAPGVVADDKHKLAAGDKVSFQIVEDREPQPRSLIVADSGELDVPYLGRVAAAGKTCKQLGEELKALLEKDYYYRATVIIGLDQASRTIGRVYLWGQLRNQGAIEIPSGENFTAGKAILRAGGFTDFANKKKVKVVRNTPDGQKQTVELNMQAILEDGKTEQDITLRPDDYIIVPARLVSW